MGKNNSDKTSIKDHKEEPVENSKVTSHAAKIVIINPDIVFDKFLTKAKTYIHDEKALALIEKAYQFALIKHSKQTRQSGEPYITHPIEVASILTDLRVDVASLIAALLHDVVEDTNTPLEEIEKEFGKVIADLVDGLTKISKIKFRSNQEKLAENFRKMVMAMAKDLRVIIIKLSDRLHNMSTLDSLPHAKRQRIAQETLEIYAPLANRLGIYSLKSELEDLCLKETKNEIYKEISRNIAAKKKERESYIDEVKSILEMELKKYGFQNAKVYGRPKHFYSIYKKMLDRQLAFKDIHDLFAFRIIVDSLKDCYEVLGIVHSIWKPMPGRFKDYIAMPKANLYQSLHTTVIRPNGAPAEIQIRTNEMHRVCEFGVAAHWAYKEKTPPQSKTTDLEKFTWLRQIMELQNDLKDPDEFLAAVKVDLFEEEIFVFTPQGDVIQLSIASTPLDFAFAVHTDIGLHAVGAKVNGRITPLRNKIHSGDIVEILTSPHQQPSKDWLGFVTTSKAKNKIRSFLRNEQRLRSRAIGEKLLHEELVHRGLDLEKMIKDHKIDLLIKAAKESGLDDLLISIGYGKISAKEVILRVYPEEEKKPHLEEKPKEAKATFVVPQSSKKIVHGGVLVSGLDNILVTFGRCCSPLPGEEIIGFITRGRGVSIHKDSCPRALDLDPARRIAVSWVEEKLTTLHNVYLRVLTNDRTGVLADVTSAISKCGANILKAQVNVSTDLKGILYFEVTLKNIKQLNEVIKSIESTQDVILVERRNAIKNHKF